MLVVIRATDLWPPTQLLKPMILGSAAAFLLVLRSGGGSRLQEAIAQPVFIAYSSLVLFASIGIPFSLWPGESFSVVTGKLSIALVLLIVLSSIRGGEMAFQNVSRVFLVGFLATGIATVVLAGRVGIAGQRLSSAGAYDPNDFAALAALCVPLSMAAAGKGRWYWRAVGIGALSVALLIVMRSGSRGGLLAALAGMTTFLFGVPRKFLIRSLIVIAIAMPILWTTVPAATKDRLMTVTSVEEDYNATSKTGRVEIWKRGLSYMRGSPIMGVGVGAFSVAEGEANRRDGINGAQLNAHNFLVQAGAEIGLPGLFALVIAFGFAVVNAASRWSLFAMSPGKDAPAALALIVSFLVSGFFLSHAYTTMLVFVLGMSTVLKSASLQHSGAPAPAPLKRRALVRKALPELRL